MSDIADKEEGVVGEAEVAQLARLSRLRVSKDEARSAAQAINDILRMMQRLQSADVSGEDDTTHVQFWGNTLRMREDTPQPGYSREELLANAPQTSDGCFIVPKVIE